MISELQHHKREALHPLFEVAFEAAQTMPPAQRADLYEGIAIAAESCDPELADMALAIACSLREAESKQLLFANLLTQVATKNPKIPTE